MANIVIDTSLNIGGQLSNSTMGYLSSVSYAIVGVSMAEISFLKASEI